MDFFVQRADLLIVTTSIIDDIHSKGELQWTDEFARFLDQVRVPIPSFTIPDKFIFAVRWCLEAYGGERTSAG
jgi:hypothetical protein